MFSTRTFAPASAWAQCPAVNTLRTRGWVSYLCKSSTSLASSRRFPGTSQMLHLPLYFLFSPVISLIHQAPMARVRNCYRQDLYSRELLSNPDKRPRSSSGMQGSANFRLSHQLQAPRESVGCVVSPFSNSSPHPGSPQPCPAPLS